MNKPEFGALLVKQILQTAQHHEWSLQGFGMFRLYLSKNVRLHVWDERFATAGVSTLHTHPWDFTSYVLAGRITDRVFFQHKEGPATHSKQSILCGPGGGLVGEPTPVALEEASNINLEAGHVYSHGWNDIHETSALVGTVTLVERKFRADTEYAHVFWPNATRWVSAEPRPATSDEVRVMAEAALASIELHVGPFTPSFGVGVRAALGFAPDSSDEEESTKPDDFSYAVKPEDVSVDDFTLSIRGANALASLRIFTAKELSQRSAEELLTHAYITKRVIAEYQRELDKLGLTLREDAESPEPLSPKP